MERPLVSIVLGAYNGAPFITSQVESILRQTYRPIELIISDDASTDPTWEMVQAYADLPFVRLYRQDSNTGLTNNFASAAARANGQYIAFSDQDDIWEETKIEKLVNAIGDAPLVYSDSLLVNEAGESLGIKLSDLKRMYSGTDSRGYILYSCVWGHGMLITRELLQHSLPMPASVHHDIWITYQAFLHGGIKYHDEVLTRYRQHEKSASRTLPLRMGTRPKAYRYSAFRKKLDWIRLMQQHERQEYQLFYSRFEKLFAAREHRRYVFSLVAFMLRYRKYFFMLSRKGLADNIVEIIKYGKGERASFDPAQLSQA